MGCLVAGRRTDRLRRRWRQSTCGQHRRRSPRRRIDHRSSPRARQRRFPKTPPRPSTRLRRPTPTAIRSRSRWRGGADQARLRITSAGALSFVTAPDFETARRRQWRQRLSGHRRCQRRHRQRDAGADGHRHRRSWCRFPRAPSGQRTQLPDLPGADARQQRAIVRGRARGPHPHHDRRTARSRPRRSSTSPGPYRSMASVVCSASRRHRTSSPAAASTSS